MPKINDGLLTTPQLRKGGIIAGVFLAVVAGFIVYTSRAATPATGLTATYFDNADLSGPSVTRVDPQVNFDWGTGSPDPKIQPTSFSARWTSQLVSPITGPVRISTQSDDGVRVWLDGQMLINSWTTHNPMENSGSLNLTKGQKYDLKIEFFQEKDGARLSLGWSGPNLPEGVIPSGYFSTTVADSPTSSQVAIINEPFASSASNFVTSGGTWSLTNGAYSLTNPSRTTTANANLAIHKQIVSGDFNLTADAKTVGTDDPWNDFSIIFGFKDSSNYYFASFNESDDSGTNGLFKVVNGNQTELVNFGSKITPNQTYKVSIKRTAGTIAITLDGQALATATDSTYTVGQVGFGSRNDAATFDNLFVTGKSGGVTAPTPTPTVTATPVPTATPVQTPAATAAPVTGYPAAHNTGVPHGLAGDTRIKITSDPRTLPRYAGPCNVSVAGTTIDSKLIDCSPLTITAKNVVVKNSLVLSSNAQAITITDDSVQALIQDTEVDGQGKDASTGGISLIGRTGFKLVRVDAHRSGDILRIDGWGEVIDSWLHDPQCLGSACHNDVIQSTNATHIVINHNRMDNQHTQTSCILLKADIGPISNVTVKNNLFNGGGYTVYWYDANYKITQGTGEGIHDNRWMRAPSGGFWPKGGYYGPYVDQASSNPTWSNNVWDDSGQPI